MAGSIEIRDEASPALAAVKEALRNRTLNAIGKAVVDLFQENFRRQPDNKMGFPSTGFWADAVRSTNFTTQPDSVTINVTKQGVRQRLQGGEIRATNSKYLTIPARAEAYGKRARDFENLEVAMFRTTHGFIKALVEINRQEVSFGRKRKDGTQKIKPGAVSGGLVMYWLVESVRQAANPNVIPSTFEIAAVAISTTNALVARAMERAGRG